MYYEEKWIDGWPWYRRTLDAPWVKVPEKQMVARMRNALALIVEVTDCPERRRDDAAWLRGALLAARAAALTALGKNQELEHVAMVETEAGKRLPTER